MAKILDSQHMGTCTQMSFIVNYLINFEVKVSNSVVKSNLSKSPKKNRQTLSDVMKLWNMCDTVFYDISSQEVPLQLQQEIEARSSSLGGIRTTRAWAPFQPVQPSHCPNFEPLSENDLLLIESIRSSYRIPEQKQKVLQV